MELVVDVGVAEQVEVVEASDVVAVVDGEWQPSTTAGARGRSELHEQVAGDQTRAGGCDSV